MRSFLIIALLLYLFQMGISTSHNTIGGEWQLYDPYNPSLPSLLISDGDHFHLDPTWQVQSLEYVHELWAMGHVELKYQTIQRSGSNFRNGSQTVPHTQIQALLNAFSDMYPSQMMLAASLHTDDNRSWLAEIVGTDGQRLSFFAHSNQNNGAAPWNILYNGRMYAQYNGKLADPLRTLFGVEFPTGSISGEDPPPNHIKFSTDGLPNELAFGFNGLVPVADHFSFWLRGENIKGYVNLDNLPQFFQLARDTIMVLESVTVQTSPSLNITCQIEAHSDQGYNDWSFTCPIENMEDNRLYNFPISLEFDAGGGETFRTDGTLFGIWQQEPPLLDIPAPLFLLDALSTNPQAVDLLTDHTLSFAKYAAQIDPRNPELGDIKGEVILLGETQIGQDSLRYTIGTPFHITDGKLTRWSLSRAALNSMLAVITKLPMTIQVLQTQSDPVLNLWYAEPSQVVEERLNNFWDYVPQDYIATLRTCGSRPRLELPQVEEALEVFSYDNDNWYFSFLDLLYGNRSKNYFFLYYDLLIITDLNINSPDDPFAALLPPEFDTGDADPFRINYDGNRLVLSVKWNLSDVPLNTYQQIVDALPIQFEYESYTWMAENVGARLNDQGLLDFYECDTPR